MTALHQKICGFLFQCSLYFTYQMGAPPREAQGCQCHFPADRGLRLSGREKNRVIALFRAVFDHPPKGREGGEQLFRLCQSAQTAVEYPLTFWTVPASSGWNELALRTLFRSGLREEVQTELACRGDNLSLDAILPDNLLQAR